MTSTDWCASDLFASCSPALYKKLAMIHPRITLFLLWLPFLGFLSPAQGNNPPAPNGTVDATYPIYITQNSTINAVVPLTDGGVMLAGNFSSINSVVTPSVARLTVRGTVDSSFRSDLAHVSVTQPSGIALQSDGKVLVGLYLPEPENGTAQGVIRLNTDGSIDATFQTSGLNGDVLSLALQPDGRILVAGDFMAGEGLVRLNTDGSLDTSFVRPTADLLSEYEVVLLQPDGKILACHDFDEISRYYPDGTTDDSFHSPQEVRATQSASGVVLQPDGKLITKTYYLGTTLGRFNPDGSVDSTFSFDCRTLNKDAVIGDIKLQKNGQLLVSLSVPLDAANPMGGVVRLNSDGSVDPSFVFAPQLPQGITAMALEADGSLLVSVGDYAQELRETVQPVIAHFAAYPVPVVTLVAKVSEANRSNGQSGKLKFSRTGDLSGPLQVNYTTKGTAAPGVDYVPLSGQATIPASQNSTVVKLKPLVGSLGRGVLAAKIKVQLAGAYNTSKSSVVKVRVVDGATP